MQTQALFDVGQCCMTPGAQSALERNARDPRFLIWQHQRGNWGDLCEEDTQANIAALRDDARLFSAYTLPDDTRIWVITEADRSYTTVLLPSEY